MRDDLHSLKTSVDLLTKSVSIIVAKAISPETPIPASFISSETVTTLGLTPSASSVISSATSSTSSITSRTVTPGQSSSSGLEILDTSFPSTVKSTQITSWLSSVTPTTPVPPSDSETDSISNQINPPKPTFTSSTPSPSFSSTSNSNDLLTPDEVKEILCKSASRRNFATNLSRKLFDERTRLVSNVSGRNKKRLNPAIMSYIKSTAFKYYPCLPNEQEHEQWNLCVISIDEASRRLKNKPKKI